MKNGLENNKGFTLVELLLYVVLAGTFLLIVSSFLAMALASRVKNQTIAEVEQNGVLVVQNITQAIRNADGINSPLPGANSDTLSLSFITINPAVNPSIFALNSGVLTLQEGGAAAINLTSSRVAVSNLIFDNVSMLNTPNNIKFSFTLTHINPGGRSEYNYVKNFYGSAGLRH